MKKIYKKILLLTFLITFIVSNKAFGDETEGKRVHVYIESYNRTIADGEVFAYTFKDAIQGLASAKNVALVFSQKGNKTNVYSVDKIKNNYFSIDDGWHGYIQRGSEIIEGDDFLNAALSEGDDVFLYYGDKNKTKILSELEFVEVNGLGIFRSLTSFNRWVEKDNTWIRETVVENLANVRIHILQPGSYHKVILTNDEGIAASRLMKLGLYSFYAENYINNMPPNIVKTKTYTYLYGIENEDRVTRGEAAAFIVNHFETVNAGIEADFIDVDANTPHYPEIMEAVSCGLIHGYNDGTFRPSEPISLLQLGVVLSNMYPDQAPNETFDYKLLKDVPVWAQNRIQTVLAEGLFDHISLNWDQPVNNEMLKQILIGIGNNV